MSRPTTSAIVRQLLEDGLVEESEETGAAERSSGVRADVGRRGPNAVPGGGYASQESASVAIPGEGGTVMGRPGNLVALDGRRRILAIQLGVRHTRVSRLAFCHPADEPWREELPTPEQGDAWPAMLADRLKQDLGLPADRPEVVAVSVPGVVDESAGKVLFSPNLHWSEQVNLGESLRAVTGLPVVLVQEIRALALGHQVEHPEERDFLLVDIGEGVGAAMVLSGRLYEGPERLSGELGHIPVPGCDRRCGCGQVGCLETLLGREHLLQSAAEREPDRVWTWAELAARLREGVPDWLNGHLAEAARVIAGAMNLIGVRKLVVTGSLNELGPLPIACLAKHVERLAMVGRFASVEVIAAPRYRAAGLVAAAVERHWFADDASLNHADWPALKEDMA